MRRRLIGKCNAEADALNCLTINLFSSQGEQRAEPLRIAPIIESLKVLIFIRRIEFILAFPSAENMQYSKHEYCFYD